MNISDELCNGEMAAIERGKIEANGNGSQSQRVVCHCAEGIINGKRFAMHRPEDCTYTAARSALIFQAAEIATKKIGDPVGDSLHGHRWTAAFVSAMNQLCHNAGLIG
jgi:hypothetical protein